MQHYYIVFLGVCAVFATSFVKCDLASDVKLFKTNMTECAKETNATEEELKNALNSTMPTTRSAMCLNACFLKRVGAITPDLKMDSEKSMYLVQLLVNNPTTYDKVKDKMMVVYANCKDAGKDEKDECVHAMKRKECVVAEKKKQGLM